MGYMLGRDKELAALSVLIDKVSENGTATAVLGEAGIGKTSLLRAVADYGEAAGLLVLRTEGVEAEAQLPFACLHQLLWPVLDGAARLSEPQRQALAAAFGDGAAGRPEPFMIALATLNLLAEAAARRPVLIVADDVQWLDSPTHDVLTFIARRITSDPIVLVGTVRKGYQLAFTSAGLAAVDLGGLDDEAARAVLATQGEGLSYAATERILREAAGNPLALVELPLAVRATAEAGLDLAPHVLPLTARLERAFAARVADLPQPARDAVLAAAVNDSDDLPEILAGASALAGQDVDIDALEAAASAGLISFDRLRVRFRHPLVRSGILQAETVSRSHAAHAALSQVVEASYRRTWHRAQSVSGQDDTIADDLEDLHNVALRRGSATEAIWALERSAQLTTDSARRGRRLLLAAEHAFGLGRADLVDQLLGKAARTSLSRLDRARMEWLREIFNDGVPGDAGRVLELCGIAVESAAAGELDLALNLLLGAALRCWWADTGPAARARVADVVDSLAGVADDPRYVAALAVAEPMLRGEQVLRILDDVVIENVSDPAALWLLGMAAHAVGDPVHAVDFLGRAEIRLRQQGRLGLLSQVLVMQTIDHLELGDWDRALASIEEGRRLAQETGQPIWDTGSLSVQCLVLGLRGRAEETLTMAAKAERAAGGRRLGDVLACVQVARGYALINLGAYDQAYEELRRAFDPDDPAFHATDRFHGIMFLAEAALHAGRTDEARTVIARLAADAALTPSPTLHRHLSYAQVVLAPDDEAEELFDAALRADLVRWPWLRARIELAYGSWLRRQRRAAQARQPLRSALTTFDIIGAARWAEQTRTELRAAGERTGAQAPAQQREDAHAALSALSAQELQIARMVAEGMSNREIGERLYLSPRTIGSHLYRIFPKLDVTSRTQLAAIPGILMAQQPVQSPD
ncbi:MAG TPA: AAA family ATPase [Trebonia sp.]|nr:AAA family ATPase [Trebonia sp.]